MNTPVILFVVRVGAGVQKRSSARNSSSTIVDSDIICITNINRQVQATFDTAGQVKVTALRDRLISINPVASINAMQSVYDRNTAAEFELEKYSYVIDAIDSLSSKVELIINASASGAKVYSGWHPKTDPQR